MSKNINIAKNIATVKAIGKGERVLSATADAIVGKDADTLDKKAARTEATRRVTEFVGDAKDRQTNPDKSKTDFGRGFGSLVSAVANRLTAKDATDWLRLVEQASRNATAKGKFSVEDILAAAKRGTAVTE
jgi:hypothetical protein